MARSQAKRRVRSEVEIGEIVEAYESSGLTQAAFARSHKVALSSLSYWIRKVRGGWKQRPEPAALVPVRVVGSVMPVSRFEVQLANDRVVRVPAGFDGDELRRLLSVVESPC